MIHTWYNCADYVEEILEEVTGGKFGNMDIDPFETFEDIKEEKDEIQDWIDSYEKQLENE